jgi:hypothetical protein
VSLGRSLLRGRGGSNLNIVKLARRAWSRRKGFAVGAKVTKFATLVAAAIGVKVVFLWLQQLRGKWTAGFVVGVGVVDKGFGIILVRIVARSASEIVDLGGKVVNSDLKGVNLHITCMLSDGLEASGTVRIEDGVD